MAEKDQVVDLYGASYGGFGSDVYGEVRREAWGEEIGQNSWLTRAELERSAPTCRSSPRPVCLRSAVAPVVRRSTWLGRPAARLWGALHLARSTGCEIVGVDLHEDAVANASRMARGVFADWARLIEPEGRVLFTDPITVTGPLGRNEIAIRASIAYFLFVPPGEDERLLSEAGLRLIAVENATDNMATVAERWLAARAKRAHALREIEGNETFDAQQRFLEVTARLARERRLSRFVYLAETPA